MLSRKIKVGPVTKNLAQDGTKWAGRMHNHRRWHEDNFASRLSRPTEKINVLQMRRWKPFIKTAESTELLGTDRKVARPQISPCLIDGCPLEWAYFL